MSSMTATTHLRTVSAVVVQHPLGAIALACALVLTVYLINLIYVAPSQNPLRRLPGPRSDRLIESRHMNLVMEYVPFLNQHPDRERRDAY